MVDTAIITKINEVIEAYLAENSSQVLVPVKELMPAFIRAGIFKKDQKNGQPIRKILRALDAEDALDRIPFVYAERNETATYWYFKLKDAPVPEGGYEAKYTAPKTEGVPAHKNDETYVIDLCDEVLGMKAYRQKKFAYLLGDLHKDGKTKTELPVDAYYDELKLVVEYKKEHLPSASKNKRQEKETISGMPRSEQRIRYDERKAKTLPAHGIQLVHLRNDDFSCDEKNNIIRDEARDMKVVMQKLKNISIPE